MDSLNTILNSGTYGENVSRHNDNNSKIKQAITTLENVAIANKGYFDTLASLQAAFPSPKAGNIAYVANVASSTGYYIYNVVSGVWTATTTEAPAVGVAISNYAQHGYSSSPKTLKQVDDEVVQLAGAVSVVFNPTNGFRQLLYFAENKIIITYNCDVQVNGKTYSLQLAAGQNTFELVADSNSFVCIKLSELLKDSTTTRLLNDSLFIIPEGSIPNDHVPLYYYKSSGNTWYNVSGNGLPAKDFGSSISALTNRSGYVGSNIRVQDNSLIINKRGFSVQLRSYIFHIENPSSATEWLEITPQTGHQLIVLDSSFLKDPIAITQTVSIDLFTSGLFKIVSPNNLRVEHIVIAYVYHNGRIILKGDFLSAAEIEKIDNLKFIWADGGNRSATFLPGKLIVKDHVYGNILNTKTNFAILGRTEDSVELEVPNSSYVVVNKKLLSEKLLLGNGTVKASEVFEVGTPQTKPKSDYIYLFFHKYGRWYDVQGLAPIVDLPEVKWVEFHDSNRLSILQTSASGFRINRYGFRLHFKDDMSAVLGGIDALELTTLFENSLGTVKADKDYIYFECVNQNTRVSLCIDYSTLMSKSVNAGIISKLDRSGLFSFIDSNTPIPAGRVPIAHWQSKTLTSDGVIGEVLFKNRPRVNFMSAWANGKDTLNVSRKENAVALSFGQLYIGFEKPILDGMIGSNGTLNGIYILDTLNEGKGFTLELPAEALGTNTAIYLDLYVLLSNLLDPYATGYGTVDCNTPGLFKYEAVYMGKQHYHNKVGIIYYYGKNYVYSPYFSKDIAALSKYDNEITYLRNKGVVFKASSIVPLLNIMHVSDIHVNNPNWEKNLREVIRIGVDNKDVVKYIINTGDNSNGFPARDKNISIGEMQSLSNVLSNVEDIIPLQLIGNHDTNVEEDGSQNIPNTYTQALTKKEQADYNIVPFNKNGVILGSRVIGGETVYDTYYYLDDATHKIRFIAIDYQDYPIEPQTQESHGVNFDATKMKYHFGYILSQRQLDWLVGALMSTPEDYGIILLSHQIPDPMYTTGDFYQGIDLIPDIIDAYKRRTSFFKISEINDRSGYRWPELDTTVNCDFSVKSQTEFICILGGHIHTREIIEVVSGKNIVAITSANLFQGGFSLNVVYRLPHLKRLYRGSENTRNSFNIISINRESRKITVVKAGARIGLNVDDEITSVISY